MLLRHNKSDDEPKDGTMSLMDHLYELRRRIGWAALGLLVGTIIGFIWYTVAIPALHIPNLGDILTRPYCRVPESKRVSFGGACQLLATDVFSPLQIRLKAAFMVGAVISSPVWLYQLWAFITPGPVRQGAPLRGHLRLLRRDVVRLRRGAGLLRDQRRPDGAPRLCRQHHHHRPGSRRSTSRS